MMTELYNKLSRVAFKLAYRAILCVWFFTRPTVTGVYVAIWYSNKILIIKNSYRKHYTIPCGRLNRGETPEQAAVRELYEEVNIRVNGSQLAFAGKYTGKYKYVTDVGAFFEVKMRELPAVKVDDREVIWARFMSVDDSLELYLNPAVRSYLNDRH